MRPMKEPKTYYQSLCECQEALEELGNAILNAIAPVIEPLVVRLSWLLKKLGLD